MSKVIVTGLKFFKGEVEGQHYDTTTIFVDMRMDESKGTQFGRATVEMKWQGSDMFHRLKPLLQQAQAAKVPFYCEIEREEVAIGKGQTRMELTAINPLPLPTAAPQQIKTA
jgi:hypothetical protein